MTKTSTAKLFLHALQKRQIRIFPEFVFDFLHGNLPFYTQGLAEVFFCKLFASGNGKHDASTTLYTFRLTKTATAKFFLHVLQKRQNLHVSFLTVKPAENLNVGNEICNACMENVLPANVKEIFVRPKIAHPTVCRTNTLFAV